MGYVRSQPTMELGAQSRLVSRATLCLPLGSTSMKSFCLAVTHVSTPVNPPRKLHGCRERDANDWHKSIASLTTKPPLRAHYNY
eukprot:1384317-Amphidinium_carterae.1